MKLRLFDQRKRIQICHSDAGELSVVRRRGLHLNAIIIHPDMVASLGVAGAARVALGLLIEAFDTMEQRELEGMKPPARLN